MPVITFQSLVVLNTYRAAGGGVGSGESFLSFLQDTAPVRSPVNKKKTDKVCLVELLNSIIIFYLGLILV